MKCFAYLRVSSVGQNAGDGFPRQLEACEKYAAANDLEIAEVFRESMTGKSDMEDRPALSHLLVALEENGIKTVVIEKLDRLARDLMIQETIVADMQRHSYTLISTMEPDLCSTDPSRVLMRQIFGAVAQYDKTMIVLKTRAARERIRARDGKCEGAKAYGELPGEAEVLRVMRLARLRGDTYKRIADDLLLQGIQSRSGRMWTIGAVAKILSRKDHKESYDQA